VSFDFPIEPIFVKLSKSSTLFTLQVEMALFRIGITIALLECERFRTRETKECPMYRLILTLILASSASHAQEVQLSDRAINKICASIVQLNRMPNHEYSRSIDAAYERAQAELDKALKAMKVSSAEIEIDHVCDL
jgi:hypothetical protein